MRQSFVFIILFCSSAAVYAGDSSTILNHVSYQDKVAQWAVTNTAAVKLSIDATAKDQNILTVQQQVLTDLDTVVPKQKWHIENFQRSEDRSGLERLHWDVSARLSQLSLVNLRDVVSKISSAGQKFVLNDFNFQPSLAEIEKVRSQLRSKVYQQAEREAERLNKTYPMQHYFVHTIHFSSTHSLTSPRQYATYIGGMANKTQSMNVGRKIMVTAQVDLASIEKPVSKK